MRSAGMLDQETLEAASLVLDACGRPTAPGGCFVDLPYMLSLHNRFTEPGPTLQQRVENATKALFFVKGIVFESGFPLRVKWPSGRYLFQNPAADLQGAAYPTGTGGNLIALNEPEPIPPGGKIAVEISPFNADFNTVDLQFLGVLRYFMQRPGGGAPLRLELMTDPIDALESLPRYRCGPPQNIMAPEWLLGNQCQLETPNGYDDESFTFFSPPIACGIGQQVFDTSVVIPGGQDVVVKRVRGIVNYSLGDHSGTPVPLFAMRLPNGYSLTGGDMIPVSLLYWWPWLPTVRIPTGQRIIIDMSNTLATGSGTLTTTFEFDAVKRRKVR